MYKVEPIQGAGNIKPYKLDIPNDSNTQGRDFFPLYRNVFICARKKSGKSNLIGRILEHMSNKMTTVYIFSPTVEIDGTYKHILQTLNKNNVNVMTFKEIIDEDGTNNLKLVMDMMREEIEEENKPKIEKPIEQIKYVTINEDSDDEEKKERKPKKIANKNIIVIDDSSHSIHLPIIETLLKSNRHYKCMTIISNQSIVGLSPAARKQFDNVILLKGHKEDKLKVLYNDMDLNVEFDEFFDIYKHATEEMFNFLNVDVRDSSFRKNFNYNYKNFEK